MGVGAVGEHQFNFRCVHSGLPVNMDLAFGFIPNKTSRFDLAHSEPAPAGGRWLWLALLREDWRDHF